MRLRGAGELLGTRQSGFPEFRLADLAVHDELLATARDDARLIIETDPELAGARGRVGAVGGEGQLHEAERHAPGLAHLLAQALRGVAVVQRTVEFARVAADGRHLVVIAPAEHRPGGSKLGGVHGQQALAGFTQVTVGTQVLGGGRGGGDHGVGPQGSRGPVTQLLHELLAEAAVARQASQVSPQRQHLQLRRAAGRHVPGQGSQLTLQRHRTGAGGPLDTVQLTTELRVLGERRSESVTALEAAAFLAEEQGSAEEAAAARAAAAELAAGG